MILILSFRRWTESLLSSDRKTGYGSRDLYSAISKSSREHLALSVPITSSTGTTDKQRCPRRHPYKYPGDSRIRHHDMLFDQTFVYTTEYQKLEILSHLLLIYPTLKLDLIGMMWHQVQRVMICFSQSGNQSRWPNFSSEKVLHLTGFTLRAAVRTILLQTEADVK